MEPFSVLRKPLLSEKSLQLRDAENKYLFEVDIKASKKDIKRGIEKLFNVPVESVNTHISRGKDKRRGMYVSKRSNTKKAFVTLQEGAKISIFEDQ